MSLAAQSSSSAIMRAGSARHGYRPDIQGLRAVAVVLVLGTHAFPDVVPGGFLGVDVFFVISGYLITGLLWHELQSSGRIDLGRFYLRRAARLLPLAVLVLLATGLATHLLLSPLLLDFAPTHLRASGLYIQNWALISESATYAARDQGASPFQHFWTLSVEEQFYIVLPVLLLVCWRRAGARASVAALTAVSALSLGFALGWSPENPAASYYNTFTRAWEFGLGGLAAVFAVRVVGPRGWVQVAGLAALTSAVFAVDGETATPGPTTVLLVFGVILLLTAHSKGSPGPRTLVDRILASTPLHYLGDISYGLYLWHWPALLVAGELFPRDPNLSGLCGLALGFFLAALTHPFESWARRSIAQAGSTRRRAALIATAVIAMAIASVLAAAAVLDRVNPAAGPPEHPTTGPTSPTPVTGPEIVECVGAAAMLSGADCETKDGVTPGPESARKDMPHEECKESLGGREVITCTFGDGATRVALVGDSHAQRLIPALEPLLEKNDWTLTTYLKSSCPFSAVEPVDNASSCGTWNGAAMEQLLQQGYDLVVVNSASGILYRVGDSGLASEDAAAAGMAEHWRRLADGGAEVVAVRDNPQPGYDRFDPPACVLREGPAACDADEAAALRPDPQVAAVAQAGDGVHLVDLTEYYCRDGRCPSVIGGILVYRDGQHVHSAFARTLAPFLDTEIQEVVRQDR